MTTTPTEPSRRKMTRSQKSWMTILVVVLIGVFVVGPIVTYFWVLYDPTPGDCFTLTASNGRYTMGCACIANSFGVMKTIVCDYSPTGKPLLNNLVVQSGQDSKILIDGVKVPTWRFSFWYLSDTVRATKVQLTPEQKERVTRLARKYDVEGVLAFLKQVIVPKFRKTALPASAPAKTRRQHPATAAHP